MAAQPSPVLCLGEALVDLICERPVTVVTEAAALVPHFGGAAGNVAALIARSGVPSALAGGVGEDPWGAWLAERLAGFGVSTDYLDQLPDSRTPVALVTVDHEGEPSYTIYGESLGTVDRVFASERRLEVAVGGARALVITSNTLVRSQERETTMAARRLALAAGKPVIFDPNLRLHRWSSRADAAASANACVHDALLVRCTAEEARLLSGEDDLERAALALRKAGAHNVVISLGAEGAILRGKLKAQAPGVPARVRSTIGAGDAMTAMLVARLAQAGFYEPALAAGLRDAVVAGAAACERWGALD